VGTQARFGSPEGIAIDTNGNYFVVDTANLVIRRISSAGEVTTIAGQPGIRTFTDGVNSAARFYSPANIATDLSGNAYVTDNYSVRELSPSGTNWTVTTIAGQTATPGYRDGMNLGARFNGPFGLAVGSDGTIYVADGPVRKIARVGTDWVVSTVANAKGYTITQNNSGPNFTNIVGVFTASASAIALDGFGHLFVSDQTSNTISELTFTASNWVSAVIGGATGTAGTNDGVGTNALFTSPGGITVDHLGNVYITDAGTTIRRLTPTGPNWISGTVAGSYSVTGYSNGIGTNAQFASLYGIVADAQNNLEVTDSANGEVRKVTSAGAVTTLAGSYVQGGAGSADGVGDEAQFDGPAGVALDAAGNVYVSDQGNNTVRMVTPAGSVSTLAGTPMLAGTNDGVGSEALFNGPDGIAVDQTGNIFVADGSDTIRMITPGDAVRTIAGTPNVSGNLDGPGSIALFGSTFDVVAAGPGDLFVADQGNSSIRELRGSGSNWVVSTAATLSGSIAGLALAADGSLFVINGNKIVHLALAGTNWAVTNTIPLSYFGYHIAVDSSGNIYMCSIGSREVIQIAPSGTNWISTVIGGSYVPPYYNGGNADGAGTAALFEIPYGIAVDTKRNLYISDAVNDNIRLGIFDLYDPIEAVTYTNPPMTGSLQVTLTPPEANGQWRFPWELTWHQSGYTATNLAAGNYQVEFLNAPGWLDLGVQAVQVTTGQLTGITNEYLPTVDETGSNGEAGSLTVYLGPTPPSGAGWRFLGQGGAYFPNGFTTNLFAGTYLIEFAPVGGRVSPPSQAVQVVGGQPSTLTVNYLLAAAPPAGVYLPFPVPESLVSDEVDYPFGFNGQLQTDIGYGSGVAAGTNVVLTAAHLVFNDQTLAYVSSAYWFFRQDPSMSDPTPQAARGWYVLSGYAAQRTNDLQSGYSPDESTPPSRNLDVAALYFPLPVAGGGSGGYLPSDNVPNTWLSGSAPKMLVGYPVDGSQFGNSSIVPGQMYQTAPQTFPFTIAQDPVAGEQEVYTAPWLLSYPGNSGGPLYVQFNGSYYPAAVYLGTLFSGSQPYASLVRAIDSNVVVLISQAGALGDSGTNNSGGGVITIVPTGVSSSHPAYLIMSLGPPAAVAAGAAWEFTDQPAADYLSTAQSVQELSSSASVSLQFLAIPGWNLPPSQTLSLEAGANTFAAAYTVAISWPTPAPIASGTPLGPQQLDAVVTAAPGSYSYDPPVGTVLGAGTHTLSVTFTPGDASNDGGPSTTNVSLIVLSSAAPVIQAARQSDSAFSMTWNAAPGQMYQVQYTIDLTSNTWSNLGSPILSTGTTAAISDTFSSVQKFYRVTVLP
jgi:sugar lactone lactonase YvrE